MFAALIISNLSPVCIITCPWMPRYWNILCVPLASGDNICERYQWQCPKLWHRQVWSVTVRELTSRDVCSDCDSPGLWSVSQHPLEIQHTGARSVLRVVESNWLLSITVIIDSQLQMCHMVYVSACIEQVCVIHMSWCECVRAFLCVHVNACVWVCHCVCVRVHVSSFTYHLCISLSWLINKLTVSNRCFHHRERFWGGEIAKTPVCVSTVTVHTHTGRHWWHLQQYSEY